MEEIDYKAWPYREARNTLDKIEREQSKPGVGRKHEDYVLLETGFGPSGLPHIGTFGEVARTRFVQEAIEQLAPGTRVKLVAFSDDVDGFRGIPSNVPDQDALKPHLGKPLCDVPDPFGEHDSFSGHMNAKLCSFLDSFGFEYEFKSSKDQYRSGVFNEGLELIVERYEQVRDLVTKDLRDATSETWSPFLPICSACGKVNTTRVIGIDKDTKQIEYACDKDFNAKITHADGTHTKWKVRGCRHQEHTPVTDGRVKVGWKVDWALRWFSLGVDYEMYGKDLINSAKVSAGIVRILGGEPPAGMMYEWFNDEEGKSISKSKGNGLTIDEWLTYGPLESLSWYIYQRPAKAKKLFFGVIPKSVDDFLRDRQKFGQADTRQEKVNNAVWFVEADKRAAGVEVGYDSDITYGLLLNLVSVLNTDDRDLIWDYILKYDPEAKQHNETLLEAMITSALQYYRDFVAPTKAFAMIPQEMMPALEQFRAFLASYEGTDGQEIQSACYAAGKDNDLALKAWFKAMYRLMIGQEQGPRIGTFASLYGVPQTLALIDAKLEELG